MTLLFEYINVLFPDPLERFQDIFSGKIRFSIASLIIIFPLYIVLTRLVNQDIRRNPEKRHMGIRKWLIYITLFVAGATIVGDLIALINTFLGGDLTIRFVLKVSIILVVVGAVFLYYFYDLKGKWERDAKTSKIIGGIVSIIVLLSIVSGFFVIGSPQTQRLIRFDQEKVRDLQNVQRQIITFWQTKEQLPQTLDELEDPLIGFRVPVDPQTEEPYSYRVISALTFELCADFNRENILTSKEAQRPIIEPFGFESGSFDYTEGKNCFERTIDPDRFPLLERRF